MKIGKPSDMISMMIQLNELESFLTPDMNVYNSIIQTGFSFLLFSQYPNFLSDMTIVEEFIEQTINGLQVKLNVDYSKEG